VPEGLTTVILVPTARTGGTPASGREPGACSIGPSSPESARHDLVAGTAATWSARSVTSTPLTSPEP
jgi:hypothetical protein